MPDADPVKLRLTAAKTIAQRMKALGLSKEELSQQTKISIATLEALEQGQTKRLSEDRLLNPKLKALAEALELPVQTVQSAVWRPSAQQNTASKKIGRVWSVLIRLKDQIDLDSGQGFVAYGLLVAVLLYGLNLQQRRLAADNLLTLEPIAPLPLNIHLSNTPVRLAEQVENVNPAVEFQPLARLEDPAIRRQILQEALQLPEQEPQHGLLEVALTSPAQVIILQQGEVHAQLKAESGVLRWRLRPAFTVTVIPPDSGTVRWNNQLLTLLDETRGQFQVDAP